MEGVDLRRTIYDLRALSGAVSLKTFESEPGSDGFVQFRLVTWLILGATAQ